MLLKFRKIKKFFDPLNKCRTLVLVVSIFFVISWAQWGGEIVFMLSEFESSQFATLQVPPKHTTSPKVFGDSGVNYVISGSRFRLEPSQFILESGKKLVGGFIEIIFPVSAYCEEIPYQKTEQQSCDRKQWIGNYFSKECYHLSDLAVFFILGYLSALVIRVLWIDFFT